MNPYKQMAAITQNRNIKTTLLDIAKEEKTEHYILKVFSKRMVVLQ